MSGGGGEREREREGAHLKQAPCSAHERFGGAWVAKSIKHPTLGFGSGHDLTVHEFEPFIRLCGVSTAWNSLSPSLPLPCSLSLSLSKINKH